jgi:Fur family zinc uptake transcriptional regulator
VAAFEQEHACTAPSQHVHDAAEYVRNVERACRERGLRMTPLRADVIQILATSRRPLKAYDLLDQIQASKARAAPATAYRTLNFLMEQGFIHRLESLSAFVVCHHPGQPQHVAPFLICNRCHQATELEDEQTGPSLKEIASSLGFSPLNQTLEVRGLCAECSNNGSPFAAHRLNK